jgi:hypothetical protein
MSAVERRQPSRWQTNVVWPQLRRWEKLEHEHCPCGCGRTAAVCLRAGAVTGEQLLARSREGKPVLGAAPRTYVRLPTFRSTIAQPICRMVQRECVDFGATSVWITHDEMAELCRRELGRGSAKSSHNAVHEAEATRFVDIDDGHVPGEECRKCKGAGEHADGTKCVPCGGTGQRESPARTKILGNECARQRAGNFYRPGPAMLAAIAKAGVSPAALMRQAELAAQAEKEHQADKDESARRAEKERVRDRRQDLVRQDTERRSRVRAAESAILASVANRPDTGTSEGLSPKRSSVSHDRVGPEAPSAHSVRSPAAPGSSTRQAPPEGVPARPPLAGAENTLPIAGATERPTAAPMGVSLVGRQSPASPLPAAIAPGAGPKAPERPRAASGNPRPTDAPKGLLRGSAGPAPPPDTEVEELVLRAARKSQERLQHLAAAESAGGGGAPPPWLEERLRQLQEAEQRERERLAGGLPPARKEDSSARRHDAGDGQAEDDDGEA